MSKKDKKEQESSETEVKVDDTEHKSESKDPPKTEVRVIFRTETDHGDDDDESETEVSFANGAFPRVKPLRFPANEKREEEVETLRRTLLSPTINLPILKVESQEDILPVLSLYTQKEIKRGLSAPIFRIVSSTGLGILPTDETDYDLPEKVSTIMDSLIARLDTEGSIPVFVSLSDYRNYKISLLFEQKFLSGNRRAIIVSQREDERNGFLAYVKEQSKIISGLKNIRHPFERDGFSRGDVQSVSPMTDAERKVYLHSNLSKMAKSKGVRFSPNMLSYLCNQSISSFPSGTVTRKAFEVLDCAMGIAKAENETSINQDRITRAFENVMPSHDRMKALIDMDKRLKQKIFGQDEAINDVYNLILSQCDEEPEKPTVLGFFGPSGVGKTALAEEISWVLTGRKVNCINMAEYADDFKMSILIGSAKGYVDSEKDGLLAEIIKENPRAVILLDEFEKAHPKVRQMFLGMFDKGSLNDNHAGLMDFRKATIVLTSNAGIRQQKTLGFNTTGDVLYSADLDLIKEQFPPELLGRIDAKIMFQPLSKEALRSILDKFMGTLDKRFKTLGIKVSLSEAAKEELIKIGQDPSAGARPLMNILRQKVKTPIEIAFFKKEITPGSNVIVQSVSKMKDFKVLPMLRVSGLYTGVRAKRMRGKSRHVRE